MKSYIYAMSKIIDLLKEFGLSINSAKAYMALLKKNPVTGYEISSESGIPRSAVYSVLKKLESTGIINSIGDSPKKYIPLEPAALLNHFEHSHKHRLGELEDCMNELDGGDESFDFWHLNGYRNLILKLKETIKKSKKSLAISLWNRELKAVNKELVDAENRGVKISIFSFCELESKIGNQITYKLDEGSLESIWSHKIILVSDHVSTIMGSARKTKSSRSIYTRNEAIIEIAMNHIILDITLAGQRLGIDSGPMVKHVMKNPDLHLNTLLKNKNVL